MVKARCSSPELWAGIPAALLPWYSATGSVCWGVQNLSVTQWPWAGCSLLEDQPPALVALLCLGILCAILFRSSAEKLGRAAAQRCSSGSLQQPHSIPGPQERHGARAER